MTVSAIGIAGAADSIAVSRRARRGKITGGISGLVGLLDKVGIEPATLLGSMVFINETVGAVCIVLGLFTRFFAASIAIELAVALWIDPAAKGFGGSHGGYEYVLMWASSCSRSRCAVAAHTRLIA